MKLGFVTAILPNYSLDEVLETAANIGYDCVEVMCWPHGMAERRYAGVTHIDISKFTVQQAEDVLASCRNYSVKISALGYYPNPLSPDKEESETSIQHIKKVIDASSILGINQMNTFIGRDWKKSVEQNWPLFQRVWEPLVEYAESKKVKIGIENCPMLFTIDEWPGGKNLMTTPDIWERIFKVLDSEYFGLNFDPSHFIWQQMDYVLAIKEFGHKFYHVHAKDACMDLNSFERKGIMAYPNDFHNPKLPGLGDVDWNVFFSELKKINYQGSVCVEVEDRNYESTLERKIEALKLSFNFLHPYFTD